MELGFRWEQPPGANALIEREYPDLVILDLAMPGVDGYAVCKRIRSGPAGGHTQIVALSALDGVDDKVRAFQLGADDYLVKPSRPASFWRESGPCWPARNGCVSRVLKLGAGS